MIRFEDRYLQLDLARSRVFDRAEILDLLQLMKRTGYNSLCVYLEGSFAYNAVPGIIRKGVMTPEDAKWLVQTARDIDITVMPMTNLFGHMEQFVDRESHAFLSDSGKNQVDFTSQQAEDFAITIAKELSEHFDTEVVHVGADETDLDEKSRGLYADFLARVCRRLLADGIVPAIWSDMLWMHPELVKDIPRECIIFDWNYYGHRPESLVFWKEHGFENVVVCPADQSWEGFINCYRTSGHLKARMDAIGSGEVEAFLVDGAEAGVRGACLTTWEHRFGSALWSQLVPVARAGLYMSGEWTPEGCCQDDDEAGIEHALFGRTTPYTAITNILRKHCQMPLFETTDFYPSVPRTALFTRDALAKYLVGAPAVADKLLESWMTGINQAENMLARWEPESSLESRCLTSMRYTITIIRTSRALMEAAAKAYKLYHSAAVEQFENAAKSSDLLKAAAEALDALEPDFESLEKHAGAVIANSGHPRADTDLVLQRLADINWLAESIRSAGADIADPELSNINLLSWRRIVGKAISNEPVWGYI